MLDGVDGPEVEPSNPLAAIATQLLTAANIGEGRKLAMHMLLCGPPNGLDVLQDSIEDRVVPEISLLHDETEDLDMQTIYLFTLRCAPTIWIFSKAIFSRSKN